MPIKKNAATEKAASKSVKHAAAARKSSADDRAERSAWSTPGVFMACVTPDDSHWIAKWSDGPNRHAPFIISGVLADIGAQTLRRAEAAATLKLTPCNCLWIAVNHDMRDFKDHVPVYLDPDRAYIFGLDAESMRRDMSEWIGTLINLGVRVARAGRSLDFMTESREFELLADSAELAAIKYRTPRGV
jgi:hypothetical protein